MDMDMDNFLDKSKLEAALLAREMLSKEDAIIWDTETTGLRNAGIVTIGAINLRGEILLDLLLKPDVPIESGASAVHGIFNADVADCYPFSHHVIQIWDALQRGPWIVYNLQYDRPILQRLMSECRYSENFIARRDKKMGDFCAMEAFAEFYGQWNDYRNSFTWKKLVDACDYLGISGIDDPAHSAIGDCRRTLAVLKGMDAWLTAKESKAA